MPELRVIRDSFPGDPVLDLAVSQALLERVAAGELPETLRLARSGPMVAFAKRDAVAAGYGEAVRAARAAGFEPTPSRTSTPSPGSTSASGSRRAW